MSSSYLKYENFIAVEVSVLLIEHRIEKLEVRYRGRHQSDCMGHDAILSHERNKYEAEKRRATANFNTQLTIKDDLIEKERKRVEHVEAEMESLRSTLQEENEQHHQRIKVVLDSTDTLKDEKERLEKELKNINKQLKAAERGKMAAVKKVTKTNELVAKQRTTISELKSTIISTEDELIEESKHRYELEKMISKQLEIKRKKRHGRGGSGKWPVKIIQMIIEMLVSGTPPASVPRIMQTMSFGLLDKEAKEVPSMNFVRECRPVAQNLNEMLVAFALGSAPLWKQLHTDGTGRRQTAMQNLIIRAKTVDGGSQTLIASSCIFAESESAVHIHEAIMEKVSAELIKVKGFRISRLFHY